MCPKIKITFIDEVDPSIQSTILNYENSILIKISYEETDTTQSIWLDVPTAIQFCKTLSAEINKAKEYVKNE